LGKVTGLEVGISRGALVMLVIYEFHIFLNGPVESIEDRVDVFSHFGSHLLV
jgi:hypothetical protein